MPQLTFGTLTALCGSLLLAAWRDGTHLGSQPRPADVDDWSLELHLLATDRDDGALEEMSPVLMLPGPNSFSSGTTLPEPINLTAGSCVELCRAARSCGCGSFDVDSGCGPASDVNVSAVDESRAHTASKVLQQGAAEVAEFAQRHPGLALLLALVAAAGEVAALLHMARSIVSQCSRVRPPSQAIVEDFRRVRHRRRSRRISDLEGFQSKPQPRSRSLSQGPVAEYFNICSDDEGSDNEAAQRRLLAPSATRSSGDSASSSTRPGSCSESSQDAKEAPRGLVASAQPPPRPPARSPPPLPQSPEPSSYRRIGWFALHRSLMERNEGSAAKPTLPLWPRLLQLQAPPDEKSRDREVVLVQQLVADRQIQELQREAAELEATGREVAALVKQAVQQIA